MFNTMLSALYRHLILSQDYLNEAGLDLPIGPFSLHIRQQDQLVTLFIPLDDISTTALTTMADWPVLQRSHSGKRGTLLWSREWLDILVDLISRMLHQAENLALATTSTANENTSRPPIGSHG